MFPKGGMGGLYKKAQEMQKKMAEVQEELNNLKVEGKAGGDMVKVTVSGKKDLLSVNLDSAILKEDKEMIEDLILVAVNQALNSVEEISKEKMGSLTGGIKMPGMF